mgnify:CR=1 FL=1
MHRVQRARRRDGGGELRLRELRRRTGERAVRVGGVRARGRRVGDRRLTNSRSKTRCRSRVGNLFRYAHLTDELGSIFEDYKFRVANSPVRVSLDVIDEDDYKRLPEVQQEALFSLSCLSREQRWSDNVEWTDETWEERVVDYGAELLDRIYDHPVHYLRRELGYDRDEEIVRKRVLEGDRLTRFLLAWTLEDRVDAVRCESESESNLSQPDVTISDYHDRTLAKVEVKRVVNTGNVVEYSRGFVNNGWHDRNRNQPSVLLLFFPLLGVDEWRARTFVQGYQGVIKHVDGWNDDWMYVRTIPAPLDANRQFGALESTVDFIDQLREVQR